MMVILFLLMISGGSKNTALLGKRKLKHFIHIKKMWLYNNPYKI